MKRLESVADHSFALALISLFEAERREYDVGVVLKLALIHDLEEAITGDFTPSDKRSRGASKVKREREVAVKRLLEALPARSKAAYKRLWIDLQLQRTREARLVHQLDKLEMGLQAAVYSRKASRQKVGDFYRSAERGITDEYLRRELKEGIDDLS